MRTIFSAMALIATGALIGCGQDVVVDSPVPTTSENHGGVLIPLTDNQAYLELVNGDRVKKGNAIQTTLVTYLLQPDQKTPSSETPTSVEVKIGTPKGDQVVKLKAAPDSADPLGGSRFVSSPGPFELNQTGGEVTVEVGGKTLSGKFRGPR
ncbi:MAG: hypothetical protein ACLQGP_01765 [Isosphaeraceae bacterium]